MGTAEKYFYFIYDEELCKKYQRIDVIDLVMVAGVFPKDINANKMRACKLIRKCLCKDICEHFQNYFTLIEHEKETRSNNCSRRLPRIKKEYARKSFLYMGAKVYNELPLDI